MKKLIIGILIGLMLGSVSAASAYSVYWKRGGNTYMCTGIARDVVCRETNWKPAYSVHIVPGSIIVAFNGNVIFGCDRGITPENNCHYYGP